MTVIECSQVLLQDVQATSLMGSISGNQKGPSRTGTLERELSLTAGLARPWSAGLCEDAATSLAMVIGTEPPILPLRCRILELASACVD